MDVISLENFLAAVHFNEDGLVPVIAQGYQTGDVLMLAWMSQVTLEQTLTSGQVTYWSRSRQKVWRKGESSGHTQRLVEAFVDCDGDTILLSVDQTGPACHTGARSCFDTYAVPVPRATGASA